MRRSWASITGGALVLIVGILGYKLIRSVNEHAGGSERYVGWAVFGDEIKNVIEPVAFGDMMASIGTLIPIMRDILDDVHKMTSGPISEIANNVNELIERNSEVLDRLLLRVDDIAKDIQGVTHAEAG